ncbi:MAG: non-hydrolyzing UDP-N-acetylglucosamine 2-epimerase [Chthoniobacteraceae bacterium]
MSKPFRVMSIFGTRPEAIKLAPVIHSLRSDSFFESRVVVTGQHRQMLDGVLSAFEIVPDHDLNVMQPNQSLNALTCRVMQGLEPILAKEKPEIILVQGDTTTVFAAALAAFYLKIPVGHVEAGLRTPNKYNPFPEEINRRLTSQLSDIHFCPTEGAKQALLREGFCASTVHVTQNTVIDALLYVTSHERTKPEVLKDIDFEKRILAVTMHRRENQGAPMAEVCRALMELCDQFPDIEVVIPLHLSPTVQNVVRPLLKDNPQIHIIEPLDYFDFTYLLKKSYLILSDSGGVQEEAPSVGKPVLVLREVTERPEGVDAGINFLVGTNVKRIVDMASAFLLDCDLYTRTAQRTNPYGDGHAASRINRLLKEFLPRVRSSQE